jgi:hypothetical protein
MRAAKIGLLGKDFIIDWSKHRLFYVHSNLCKSAFNIIFLWPYKFSVEDPSEKQENLLLTL